VHLLADSLVPRISKREHNVTSTIVGRLKMPPSPGAPASRTLLLTARADLKRADEKRVGALLMLPRENDGLLSSCYY
jgi:hypothetical protein